MACVLFKKQNHRACVFYCILINVLTFAHNVPSSPSPRSNHLIYFPGRTPTNNNSSYMRSEPSLQRTSFVANLTQCALNNQPFCESKSVNNYPAEHIQKLLQEHSHRYADIFVTDLVTNDITIRVENFDDEQLCDSYEKIIYPTIGKTQDGSERYIFNTEEYKQGVRVSLCRKSGQACKMAEVFPVGYKTECKQQMVYRQLLSLGTEGQPIKNHFEFPACCSCVLHRG